MSDPWTSPGGAFAEDRSGLILPTEHASTAPVAMDLFAGAGGFTLGFEWAGIDVVAGIDDSFDAAATYLYNLAAPDCKLVFDSPWTERKWEKFLQKALKRGKGHPEIHRIGKSGWIGGNRPNLQHEVDPEEAGGQYDLTGRGCRAFFIGDIRSTTAEEMARLAGVGQFDIMMGGPPCQGLSTANIRACLEDPRNGLLWEFLRLVEEGQPKTFLIENVPQILTVAEGGLFRALKARANAVGYDVVATILDAANYGVPQHRRRALILGELANGSGQQFSFPIPTTWALGSMASGESWDMLGTKPKTKIPNDVTYDPKTQTFKVRASRKKSRSKPKRKR